MLKNYYEEFLQHTFSTAKFEHFVKYYFFENKLILDDFLRNTICGNFYHIFFILDTIPTVLPINWLFNFCRSRTARPSLNENLSKRISDGVKAVEPELFIAKSIVCNPSAKYRTIDGTCNNLYRTNMGAAGTPQSRFVPPEYGDSK